MSARSQWSHGDGECIDAVLGRWLGTGRLQSRVGFKPYSGEDIPKGRRYEEILENHIAEMGALASHEDIAVTDLRGKDVSRTNKWDRACLS